MKKIIIIHVSSGLGLHFFDWSINFLSGQECIKDPMNEYNAHKYVMTSIQYPHQLDNKLPLVTQADGISYYDLVQQEKKSIDKTDASWRKKADDIIFDNFDTIINRAKNLGYQVVLVDWHPEHWLMPTYSHRYPLDYKDGSLIDQDKIMQSYMQTFFADSEQRWNNQFVWDLRERYALTIRPYLLRQNATAKLKNQHHDVYYIDTKLLWFDLLTVIKSIFQLCALSLEKSRIAPWQEIYTRWQTVHDVGFSKDYWSILHNIVNRYNMDLSSYKIDLIKEGLLQHGLIYRYNLNLKTWQLDKLPCNTADIYQLLEENTHPREFSYSKNNTINRSKEAVKI